MNVVDEMIVDRDNGMFRFEKAIECDKTYYLRGISQEYETAEISVKTDVLSGETNGVIELSKKQKAVGVGTDLAKTFGIKIIYFDLDKSNIRKDAALDLAKIVEVMKQNPTMKVDVRSHTDSRQTADYNEKLSDRRAKSTIAWMIKKGIAADRLTGKGYGESQLVNQCSDGVECTEEQHQTNRRSEFIVIAL